MTTPVPVTPAPTAPVVQGRVVQPSATAGQEASAVYKVGQVLKEIVHALPNAFSNENKVLSAVQDIESFVKAYVPASALPALATGAERAMVEDVSKRPAPAGVSYSIPTTAPTIDYDKLAAAMVRAQAEYAASLQPAPAVEQGSDPANVQPA